jgi:hypothetical protein
METCIFCHKLLENGESTVKLGRKGCDNMNKISSENDNEISTSPGQIVHQDCRRDYTSSRSTRWTTNSTEVKGDRK